MKPPPPTFPCPACLARLDHESIPEAMLVSAWARRSSGKRKIHSGGPRRTCDCGECGKCKHRKYVAGRRKANKIKALADRKEM